MGHWRMTNDQGRVAVQGSAKVEDSARLEPGQPYCYCQIGAGSAICVNDLPLDAFSLRRTGRCAPRSQALPGNALCQRLRLARQSLEGQWVPRQSQAEPGRARQSQAEPGRARQSQAEPGRARQSQATSVRQERECTQTNFQKFATMIDVLSCADIVAKEPVCE